MPAFIVSENIHENLFQVASLGRTDLVRKLVNRGASYDQYWSEEGYNALHIAILHGHLSVVKFFLNAGVDVNGKTKDGCSPLLLAVISHSFNIASQLLKGGAVVDSGNEDGYTPLHASVDLQDSRIFRLLLRENADPKAATKEGVSVLHLAVINRNRSCVKHLLANGADINGVDMMRETPLMMAALKGDTETVKYLLQLGAIVNVTNLEGFSALHMAASQGDIDIVTTLVDSGADINLKSQTLFTPIMEAIINCHEGAALHLLQLGADVSVSNINGDQALHLAAEKDLAALFVEVMNVHDDSLFRYNDEGFNPFLSAAFHGSDAVLAAILFNCSKDDQHMLWSSISTQTHRNALHCAVAGNHVHTVALLLDYAPWPTLCVQDISGETPLFLAAKMGSLPSVRLLTAQCGSLILPNNDGLSPEDVARRNGHDGVAVYLRSLSSSCEQNSINHILDVVDSFLSSVMESLMPLSLSDNDGGNATDDCPDLIPLPNVDSSVKVASDDSSSESVFSVSDEISLGRLFSQDEVVAETDLSKSLLRPLDFSVITIADADHPILLSLSGTEKSQASSHASEVAPALGKSRWEVVVEDFSGDNGGQGSKDDISSRVVQYSDEAFSGSKASSIAMVHRYGYRNSLSTDDALQCENPRSYSEISCDESPVCLSSEHTPSIPDEVDSLAGDLARLQEFEGFRLASQEEIAALKQKVMTLENLLQERNLPLSGKGPVSIWDRLGSVMRFENSKERRSIVDCTTSSLPMTRESSFNLLRSNKIMTSTEHWILLGLINLSLVSLFSLMVFVHHLRSR